MDAVVDAPAFPAGVLEEFVSHSEDPAELSGQAGRIRGVTGFWWFVFAVTVVPTILSAQSATRSMDSLFYLAFFGPFAVFGFFAGVVTLRMDLLTPSVRDRSRPDLAVRCFLRSLGSHKWSRAFAVVAPIAQGESCERPAVPGLDVDADRIVVREARDLERYWLPMLASGAGYDRRLSRLKIRKSHRRGPLHFYRAELQVNTFPSWAIFGLLVGILPIFPLLWLTTERYTVTAEIPVVKYKSQWWVASAGLGHDGGTVGVDLPKAKARVA